MTYQNSLDFAKQLDREDPISYLRKEFHIPTDGSILLETH
jgi:kynureninase